MDANNANEWSRNQRRFQEWLALPKYERFPPTQELLAPEIGVHEVTLSKWKRLDGWQDAVNAIAEDHLGEHAPEIYGALVREAEKGSIQHIRTFFELRGELVQRQQIEHSGTVDVRNLSDAELRAIVSSSG